MNKQPLRIDIVSDVVCPWCIVGYKRLEQALSRYQDQFEVDLRWQPFELNPTMASGGQNLSEHLAEKYGANPNGSSAIRQQLSDIGDSLGFSFNFFAEMRIYNTFNAHQLLHWAASKGLQTELKLQLFSSYFTEKQALDELDVLVQAAENAGLDAAEARTVVESGCYADEVRTELHQWLNRGIHSVPAFIINGKWLLSGAQESAVFEQQLATVLASTQEAR